mgnify:CR=1 FL=1
MTWVLDSSVVIKWYVRERDRDAAVRLIDGDRALVAPQLLIYEIANIVWKKHRRGDVDTENGTRILQSLKNAPLELMDGVRFAERAWDLARRLGHPVYDCFYLACAETLDATLVTADERFLDALQNADLQSRGCHLADV